MRRLFFLFLFLLFFVLFWFRWWLRLVSGFLCPSNVWHWDEPTSKQARASFGMLCARFCGICASHFVLASALALALASLDWHLLTDSGIPLNGASMRKFVTKFLDGQFPDSRFVERHPFADSMAAQTNLNVPERSDSERIEMDAKRALEELQQQEQEKGEVATSDREL